MKLARLVGLALATWAIGSLLELVVVVAGVFVVGYLALVARRESSRWRLFEAPSVIDDGGDLARVLRDVTSPWTGLRILVWAAAWARPWSNEEDGVDPLRPPTNSSGQRWWEKSRSWSLARRLFSWSALRNPAGGLRWSRFAWHFEPCAVEWIGNSLNPGQDALLNPGRVFWCWARQGWKSGLWVARGQTTILRAGWGVHPGPLRPIDGHQSVKLQVWR